MVLERLAPWMSAGPSDGGSEGSGNTMTLRFLPANPSFSIFKRQLYWNSEHLFSHREHRGPQS